jgi:hypothetical protein
MPFTDPEYGRTISIAAAMGLVVVFEAVVEGRFNETIASPLWTSLAPPLATAMMEYFASGEYCASHVALHCPADDPFCPATSKVETASPSRRMKNLTESTVPEVAATSRTEPVTSPDTGCMSDAMMTGITVSFPDVVSLPVAGSGAGTVASVVEEAGTRIVRGAVDAVLEPDRPSAVIR